jgi:branched-chain amino acid transport system substrate-binding protein
MSAAAAHAEIVIGLAAPASGREQKAGDVMRQVAERAIADINSKGGILGEQLTLVTLDDQCTNDGAIAAANTLIQKKVKLVIGHPCARAALAAAQVYGPAGVVFIAPATRHPALTDKRAGKTIFRLSGRDDQQAASATAWLTGQPGTGPIAIVHDKTAYSRGLATGVAAALVAKAQPAPLALPITAGENVYAPIIAKLKEAKPRAVFFAGYPAEADIIVSALRAAGVDVPVLGSDSLATQEFTTQRAAKDAAVQVLARFRPSGAGSSTGDQPYDKLLDATWGQPLSASALNTAEAIFTWADAAVRAASVSAERVGPELAATANQSKPGIATFDEKGDARTASFYPVRWSGTQWVGQN